MAVKILTREFSPGARIPRTPGRRSRSWESGSADYLPSSSSWCASASGLYYSSSSSSAPVSNSQDKYQYSASGRWNNLDPTRRNKKSSTQYTKEFRQSQSDSTASTDRTRWIQLIYEEALKMTIKLATVRDITGGVGISYKSSRILTPSVAICAGLTMCGCGSEMTPSCGDNPDIMTRGHTSPVSGAGNHFYWFATTRVADTLTNWDIRIIFIRAMGKPWCRELTVNTTVWLDCECLLKSMHR